MSTVHTTSENQLPPLTEHPLNPQLWAHQVVFIFPGVVAYKAGWVLLSGPQDKDNWQNNGWSTPFGQIHANNGHVYVYNQTFPDSPVTGRTPVVPTDTHRSNIQIAKRETLKAVVAALVTVPWIWARALIACVSRAINSKLDTSAPAHS